MNKERRQFPRIDLIFKIKYLPGEDAAIEAVAKDLSYGGVAFETDGSLAPGTNIDLKIYFEEIPGDIPAKTRVVRSWNDSGKFYAAVEFVELDEEDQIIIEEYLNYYEEGIISG